MRAAAYVCHALVRSDDPAERRAGFVALALLLLYAAYRSGWLRLLWRALRR